MRLRLIERLVNPERHSRILRWDCSRRGAETPLMSALELPAATNHRAHQRRGDTTDPRVRACQQQVAHTASGKSRTTKNAEDLAATRARLRGTDGALTGLMARQHWGLVAAIVCVVAACGGRASNDDRVAGVAGATPSIGAPDKRRSNWGRECRSKRGSRRRRRSRRRHWLPRRAQRHQERRTWHARPSCARARFRRWPATRCPRAC